MQSWTSHRVEESCVFPKKKKKKFNHQTYQNNWEFVYKTNDVRTVENNMFAPLNLSTRKLKKVNRCTFSNNDIIFQVNFWETNQCCFPPHFFLRCKRGVRVAACSTCKEHGKQETDQRLMALYSDHPMVDVTQMKKMFLSKCTLE